MQTFAQLKKDSMPHLSANRVFNLIKPEMALVEAEFERQARSNVQVINYLGDYLRASGGKRVRPALLILAAYAVGGSGRSESSIRLATVMEMLHTATLVHDDIIDNAATRRNRDSVNARFGNQAAVLMGDWLYMSAFETSLKERSLEILDILTRVTRKMTEGELIQLTMIGNVDITVDEYYDVVRRKTAYLFSGCCEIGAILGGADPMKQSALRDYGMNLGIGFQIADDLLDFTADQKTLGKAAGADLLEGKVTLPLILLIEKDRSVKTLLEQIMRSDTYPEGTRALLMTKLTSGGIFEQVRQIAATYAAAATKNLEVLAKTEYRFALDGIPDYVIGRDR